MTKTKMRKFFGALEAEVKSRRYPTSDERKTQTPMKKTKTTVYHCRFPGCDRTYDRPQNRGRHESMNHGMYKGELTPSIAKPENSNHHPEPGRMAQERFLDEVHQVKFEQPHAEFKFGIEPAPDPLKIPLPKPSMNIRLALEAALEHLDHQRKVISEALEKL